MGPLPGGAHGDVLAFLARTDHRTTGAVDQRRRGAAGGLAPGGSLPALGAAAPLLQVNSLASLLGVSPGGTAGGLTRQTSHLSEHLISREPSRLVRLPQLSRAGGLGASPGFSSTMPSFDCSYQLDTKGHGSSLSVRKGRARHSEQDAPWAPDSRGSARGLEKNRRAARGGQGARVGGGGRGPRQRLQEACSIVGDDLTKPSARGDVLRVREWLVEQLSGLVSQLDREDEEDEAEAEAEAEAAKAASSSSPRVGKYPDGDTGGSLGVDRGVRGADAPLGSFDASRSGGRVASAGVAGERGLGRDEREAKLTIGVLSEAFEELARQAAVHCAERGSLLAHIWQCGLRCSASYEERLLETARSSREGAQAAHREVTHLTGELDATQAHVASLQARLQVFEEGEWGSVLGERDELREREAETSRQLTFFRENHGGQQELITKLQDSLASTSRRLAEEEHDKQTVATKLEHTEYKLEQAQEDIRRLTKDSAKIIEAEFNERWASFMKHRDETIPRFVVELEGRFEGMDAAAVEQLNEEYAPAAANVGQLPVKSLLQLLSVGKTSTQIKGEIASKISELIGLELQMGRRRRMEFSGTGGRVSDDVGGDVAIQYVIAALTSKVRGLEQQVRELNSDLEKRPLAFTPMESNALPDEREIERSKNYFQCLGSSMELPKFLRFNGKVRNKNFSKGATEQLVKDVWKERLRLGSDNQPMQDFFYDFLKKRFGIHSMVVEYGYNVLHALKRYSYDADCELFLKVLVGELGEEVYHEQMAMIESFLEMCREIDLKDCGKVSGKVKKDDLSRAIRTFLTDKNEEMLDRLVGALDRDQPGAWVKYEKLFDEDREGNQGYFAEEIRDQFLLEREEFRKGVEKYLDEEALEEEAEPGSKPREEGEGGASGVAVKRVVTVPMAVEAMLYVDCKLGEQVVEEYVKRGFGLDPRKQDEEIDISLRIEKAAFMKNLVKGNMHKSSTERKMRQRQRRLSMQGSAAAIGAWQRRQSTSHMLANAACPIPQIEGGGENGTAPEQAAGAAYDGDGEKAAE